MLEIANSSVNNWNSEHMLGNFKAGEYNFEITIIWCYTKPI